MRQGYWTVQANRRLTPDVYEMRLGGEGESAPGQFLNIRVQGCYLRRPLSVADCVAGETTVVYRVVGEGTERLAALPPGDEVDVLFGLGNGFTLHAAGETPLLIGGGVGTPPLYYLCRRLTAQGARPLVLLGFARGRDVFYPERFEEAGAHVLVTTEDGSMGIRGRVTDALPGLAYSYFYACGPQGMLRALDPVLTGRGEYSMEERMGCGFGACMGCTHRTMSGYRRLCVEGPVVPREEVIWE